MKLRTEIESPKYNFSINYWDKIFTIGSCFAENIGDFLIKRKIDIINNPFGVLYNPISIENAFKLLVDDSIISQEDLVYNQYEWHSFYHHSNFSSHDKNKLYSKIQETNRIALEYLKKSELIIITLGTSYIYKSIQTGKIVSNCHKIPQDNFEKSRLAISEVLESLSNSIELINKVNSKAKIIFTVSPVRHWKDGAAENQRSKAVLLLAIEALLNQNSRCNYFPSYEMMMDDLRDYRFYKNDLLHPSETAVEYIADKFISSIFNDETKRFMKDCFQITSSKNHKVRNKESEAYKLFLKKNIEKIKLLQSQYSRANFNNELKYFENELESIKKPTLIIK